MGYKIAVNTRLLIKDKLEGIGWFTYETLKRITQKYPEHQFYFFFDRPYNPEFIFSGNITPIQCGLPARHPILFYLWFEYALNKQLNKIKPDVFLSPDGYLSLNNNTKSLPVIHDLNFAHYPEDVPWLVRKYYNYYFPKFAKKATRIATVSEYSKKDIETLYGIDPNKIDVVYNGVNEKFGPVSYEIQQQTKSKYSDNCDYFVFVGSLHPRKNICRLLNAFNVFKTKTLSNVKLVLVGEKYWWNSDLEKAFTNNKHKEDIIFTGRLESTELNNIIASALAMTYIPYFEGFGIPILEGFKCETAVITSNVTSMPEVALGGAKLVDPFNVEDISKAMIDVFKNHDLRKQLINRGKERLKFFSWDNTADALWQSIEKTINDAK